MPPGRHRDALVERLLAEAERGTASTDEEGLNAAALEVADSELAAWFERLLGREVLAEQPPLLLGRAAFRLCGGGHQWPDVLLRDDVPPAFVEAMRSAMPMPTPPEERGIMVEQPFERWSLRDLAPARLARSMIAGDGRQAVAS